MTSSCSFFCSYLFLQHHSPPMKDTLEFLMQLCNKGLSYSTLNTARSALSNVITEGECEKFGYHPVVSRFVKAVFETKKPVPKYTTILGMFQWYLSTWRSFILTITYPLKIWVLKLWCWSCYCLSRSAPVEVDVYGWME